jgi:hypothetical protein
VRESKEKIYSTQLLQGTMNKKRLGDENIDCVGKGEKDDLLVRI